MLLRISFQMKKLSSIIGRLRYNSFFANLATLSAGTFLAQIIPFAATVVLSRLYSPEEMGEWGVFSSYASIFAIVGTLRYEGAIVKAKTDIDAYHLTGISILFAIIFTSLLYFVAVIIQLIGFKTGMSYSSLYMLPFYIFTLLLVQVLINLSTYFRKYRLIATNSINRSLGQTVSRILLGFLKSNRQGMIIGAIVGNVISLVTLGGNLSLRKCWNGLDRKKVTRLIRVNKDFPKYDLPSNLLNSVSSHCPPILLSYFFLDSVVGLFSMAHNLLYVPMSFVGSSVSQLYYKDASERYNNAESISTLTKRLFLSMYTMGIVFISILLLCNEWLFGFVLGSKWNDVGRYVVFLSPWLLLVTALSPLSTVFYVKGKQNINMFLNALGVFLRVFSIILIAFFFHSSNLTVLSFGLASSVFYIYQGYYILKLGEINFFRRDYIWLGGLSFVFISLYCWKTVSILIL